ncbi:MAG: DNA circularization protein [Steroidobacteraceae bacterium]
MGWLDSYRQASFRGVPFFVEAHDADFGRRQVTHEFPQRDTPYTEDMGRRARTYSVEAYLIGDDYPAQRDRLIAATETAGFGELVHPYLGNMQVDCTGLRVSERSNEGRMCRVSLTFVEAGQAKFPTSVADPVRAVVESGTGAVAAVQSGFLSRYAVNGFPSFVAQAGVGKLTSLSSLLQKLPISTVVDTQAVAAFFTRVKSLADNAVSLVTQPASLFSEVSGIIGSIRSVFGDGAGAALRQVRDAYLAPYAGPTSTPNRRQQRDNEDGIAAIIRRVCVVESTRFAVLQAQPSAPGSTATTSLQTRDQAIAVRDDLTESIDLELEDPAATAEEYEALAQLRADVVNNIPSAELKLPRIAQYTPLATVPSLVIAYDLYLDAGRSVEIAERNSIPHPGFVPGATPIQVVTDV